MKNYAEDETIDFVQDGTMLGCVRKDFVDLMESPAGFGETEQEAYEDLIENEAK